MNKVVEKGKTDAMQSAKGQMAKGPEEFREKMKQLISIQYRITKDKQTLNKYKAKVQDYKTQMRQYETKLFSNTGQVDEDRTAWQSLRLQNDKLEKNVHDLDFFRDL